MSSIGHMAHLGVPEQYALMTSTFVASRAGFRGEASGLSEFFTQLQL